MAARETLRLYGESNDVRIINNPVIEEDSDNRRFLNDVADWLGVKIETATNENYPDCSAVTVWDKRRFMSGPKGAPCTIELKKLARNQWETQNKPDFHVLGFTLDEKRRSDAFILGERPNTLSVLIDQGITKADCFRIIHEAGIELPAIYKKGFPNANCVGCVKATSPTYWNHVRKHYPAIFAARAAQSRDIGARLVRVNGKRIFLDELDPAAKGRPLKRTGVECGIFCEEKV